MESTVRAASMVYSSEFGGASMPSSLGRGDYHADAFADRSVNVFHASEATPAANAVMGEGEFDFQGAGAGVDSARDCDCDRPRGFHGVADSRHFRL